MKPTFNLLLKFYIEMFLFHLLFWTVAPWNMPQKNPGVQSKSKFQYIHFFWHRIALGYAKFFLCFVSGKKCQIWPKMEHKEAQVYSAGAKYCDLCLTEKTIIMLADKKSCLNIRSEILRKCPHISKFTLGMVKPNIPPFPPDGEG